MQKSVFKYITHSFDRKILLGKALERTMIFFSKKILDNQNPLPQISLRNTIFCSLCSITCSAVTNKNLKANLLLSFNNNVCTEEMMTKEFIWNFVPTNYFKVSRRDLHLKFIHRNISEINPLKNGKKQQYSFYSKRNQGFLSSSIDFFSKILQQMKGESKEQRAEDWGGPEAFKLIIFLKENFKDVVSKSPSVLVFFSASWCAHCAHLRKPFGKAALMAKEANIPTSFAILDVNLNPDIAEANDVIGIPSLKYYRDGNFIGNYRGQRTAEAIFEFVKNPPMKSKPQETLEI